MKKSSSCFFLNKTLTLSLILTTACSSFDKMPEPVEKKMNQQLSCLAQAIHGEARGESEEGRLLVGRVVATRVEHGYGNNYCTVVYAKKQFAPKKNFTPRSYASAQKAHQLGPNGITHFHSYSSRETPQASFSMSPKCKYTGKVGGHWTFSCNQGKRYLSNVKKP